MPVSLFLVAKPHGANLIGMTEFRNATSASPDTARCVPVRPFPPFEGGVWGRYYPKIHCTYPKLRNS
jgi:hypothetical protein